MRAYPGTEDDEHGCELALTDGNELKCRKSNTDKLDSRRAKLLMDGDEPNCTNPMTEMLLDPEPRWSCECIKEAQDCSTNNKPRLQSNNDRKQQAHAIATQAASPRLQSNNDRRQQALLTPSKHQQRTVMGSEKSSPLSTDTHVANAGKCETGVVKTHSFWCGQM